MELEDVVFDIDKYNSSPVKIQWFLRQAYEKDSGTNDRKQAFNYDSRTQRRTGILSRCIFNIFENKLIDYASEKRIMSLPEIKMSNCCVSWANISDNLKATTKYGEKRSSKNDLGPIDMNYNFEKIAIADASIVIFGGVFWYFCSDWKLKRKTILEKIVFDRSKLNNDNIKDDAKLSFYMERDCETNQLTQKLFIQMYHPSVGTNYNRNRLIAGISEWRIKHYHTETSL